MKVYHGSDTFIEKIDLIKCRPNKDFGRGFYVTNLREQAEDMANRVAEWHKKQPVITEFEFEEYAFEDEEYSTLRFDSYNEQWLDFIVLNRNKLSRANLHSFDIIEGPVADDAVSVRVDEYLAGEVSKNEFLNELKHKTHTHQICFCTVRSLQYIKRIDAVTDSRFYRIDDMVVKRLVADKKLSEKDAITAYYSSNTYKQLIKNSLKDWSEIYNSIEKELKL